jgi:FixJ family two-component response regulator
MLIDFAMPGMTGADVASSVHSTKPSLPTLFITGYADHRALQGINESHIIGKPFHPDELAHKVRAALAETGAGSTAPGRESRCPLHCNKPPPSTRPPRCPNLGA